MGEGSMGSMETAEALTAKKERNARESIFGSVGGGSFRRLKYVIGALCQRKETEGL